MEKCCLSAVVIAPGLLSIIVRTDSDLSCRNAVFELINRKWRVAWLKGVIPLLTLTCISAQPITINLEFKHFDPKCMKCYSLTDVEFQTNVPVKICSSVVPKACMVIKFSDSKSNKEFNETTKITKHVGGLYSNTDFCDCCFLIDNERIPAHKCILALRSEVFNAMLKSNMHESNSSEIAITDCNPVVFRCFLHYLYTDECTEDSLQAYGCSLLEIANKYQVFGLMSICCDYLTKYLAIDNSLDVLILSDMHGIETLKEASLRFICINMKSMIDSTDILKKLTVELKDELLSKIPNL